MNFCHDESTLRAKPDGAQVFAFDNNTFDSSSRTNGNNCCDNDSRSGSSGRSRSSSSDDYRNDKRDDEDVTAPMPPLKRPRTSTTTAAESCGESLLDDGDAGRRIEEGVDDAINCASERVVGDDDVDDDDDDDSGDASAAEEVQATKKWPRKRGGGRIKLYDEICRLNSKVASLPERQSILNTARERALRMTSEKSKHGMSKIVGGTTPAWKGNVSGSATLFLDMLGEYIHTRRDQARDPHKLMRDALEALNAFGVASMKSDVRSLQMNKFIFDDMQRAISAHIDQRYGPTVEGLQRFLDHLNDLTDYDDDVDIANIREQIVTQTPKPEFFAKHIRRVLAERRGEADPCPEEELPAVAPSRTEFTNILEYYEPPEDAIALALAEEAERTRRQSVQVLAENTTVHEPGASNDVGLDDGGGGSGADARDKQAASEHVGSVGGNDHGSERNVHVDYSGWVLNERADSVDFYWFSCLTGKCTVRLLLSGNEARLLGEAGAKSQTNNLDQVRWTTNWLEKVPSRLFFGDYKSFVESLFSDDSEQGVVRANKFYVQFGSETTLRRALVERKYIAEKKTTTKRIHWPNGADEAAYVALAALATEPPVPSKRRQPKCTVLGTYDECRARFDKAMATAAKWQKKPERAVTTKNDE